MRPFLSFSLSLLFFAVAGHSPARAGLIYVTLETAVVSFDISSGNSATIAGTKSTVVSGLSDAMGLVFDKDGYLYAVQYTPRLVSKIDITTGMIVSGGATSSFVASGMGFPFGLAFDSSGNLFTASYTDNAIFAYDSFGTPLYSFSTGGGSSARPRYVAFNTEGSGFNQTASAPIPEPGTWAAMAIFAGGAAYAGWRRRRKV
jgi:hypothetical protein